TRCLSDWSSDVCSSDLLLKNPGSTVLAVLILSLGIGGNTAVWSVLDPTILHPLPAKESERLVAIREVDALHDQRWGVSPPLFARSEERRVGKELRCGGG